MDTLDQDQHRYTSILANPAALVRRLPFSLGLLAVMLAVGAVSGTLFEPIETRPGLLPAVGYGLPALRAGQLWTLLTSMAFTWQPWMLATIGLSILLFVIPLELIAGSSRAALTFVAGHIGGYLLTSVLVSWPLARLGTAWGKELAGVRDVGASAGAFGCAAALSWFLPPRLVRGGQLALAAYLSFWLLSTHRVWDVEHALAALIGVAMGRAWRREDQSMKTGDRQASFWNRTVIRQSLAVLAALIGLTNLASVILAGADRTVPDLAERIPGAVLNGSRSFVTLAGFLLILLARGLAQGRRTAWLAGVLLLETSAIAHILKGLHVQEATVASIAAVVLASQIDAFRVRPDVPTMARAGRAVAALAAGFTAYAAIGLYSFRNEFSPPVSSDEAIKEFLARLVFLSSKNFSGDTERARWFLDSLSVVWVGLVIAAVVVLLRPRLRPHEGRDDDRARAEAILRTEGRTTTAPMTLWPGNTVLLSTDGRAYLSYRLVGDVALVLGDPIGPHDALPALVDQFLAQCDTAGWTPCFYGVTPPALDLYTRRGLATIQVAEDAIVWLEHLEFKGKRWQDVRSAINKAKREGIRFEWFDQATGDRAIRDQLWEISDAWLADKGLPEMGFTLGQLTDPPDPTIRTAIAIDATNQVHGFVTWLPIYAESGWVIDLMRRRSNAFRGVMEFLIAESAMHFREEGYRMFSLASAPLARIERPGDDVTNLQRGLDLLAQRLDAFYHFAPLFEFKRKFDPAWSPVYLAYPGLTSLPKITVAIVRAYLPSMGLQEIAGQVGGAAAAIPRRLLNVSRGGGTSETIVASQEPQATTRSERERPS